MSGIPANSTMEQEAFNNFLADLSVPYNNEPSGGGQSSPPLNFWLNPVSIMLYVTQMAHLEFQLSNDIHLKVKIFESAITEGNFIHESVLTMVMG
jgi:hypothetical protein